MRLLRFLRGYLCLTVRGASPQVFVNRLAAMGVSFWDPVPVDPVTFRLCVGPPSLEAVCQAAEKSQCILIQTQTKGFWSVFYGLKKRPVLLSGLALALVLTWTLSGRIWVFEVEGCETCHPQQILRTLEELGVGVGTRGRDIDAQKLETRMKLRLNDLEWFTINVTGARAVVVVRERRVTPELLDEKAVCNVVASTDGLITEIRVLDGVGLVQAGQAVEAGQLLISGIQDHGIMTQVWHAQGEIYARTWRDSRACTPASRLEKTGAGERETRWALVVGKKRFNFGQNSGISTAGYDKITDTWTLTLPGEITLPLRLIRERTIPWTGETIPVEGASVREGLQALAEETVLGQMSAGQIERSQWQFEKRGELWVLRGKSVCTEQIGRESPLEIDWIVSDREDDGD